MTKKEKLIQTISQFENEYFNDDQKTIAIKILEQAPEQEVQAYADFIFMKRGPGFGFDYSPEVAKGRIITLLEDKNKRINVTDQMHFHENKLIIGDNYNALKALEITHKGKIDIIYIDPPYNTEAAKKEGNQSSKENATYGKFIYKDKFGRNGWLNMMKVRLTLAREILNEEGVIFVSIDDNEQAYLKILMDDIFGESNFIASIILDKTSQGTTLGKGFKKTHEYVICFSKSEKFSLNYERVKDESKYKYRDKKGFYAISNKLNSISSYLPQNKKRGYTIYWKESSGDLKIRHEYDKETLIYKKEFDKTLMKLGYIPIRPGVRNKKQTVWNWSPERLLKDYKSEIIFRKDAKGNVFPYIKNRKSEGRNPLTIQKFDTRKDGTKMIIDIFGQKIFDYAKPVSLIKWLINRTKNKNPIILDFFAGSGTTAQAVMDLNREDGGDRKFILCTNNEN